MRYLALFASLCAALFVLSSTARATDVVRSWAQTYQGTAYGEGPLMFTVDSKGSVYIASDLYFSLNENFWIIRKLNSLGQLQWTQSFFASGAPQGMAVDLNGNLFLTSYEIEQSSSSDAALTVKFLSNGNLDWIVQYPNGDGQAVHTDSLGNCYVGGTYLNNGVYEGLLLEYSPNGEILNQVQRNDINTGSVFFCPNGSLVINGNQLGNVSPLYEVLTSAGNLVYTSFASNSSTDQYQFRLTCDSSSNVYFADQDSTSTGSSFMVFCYNAAGQYLWNSISYPGLVQQISASDSNHAYVLVNTGPSMFADEGFGAGGKRLMNVQSQGGLIAADGTKGLISASENITSYMFSEVNESLQTLWTQTSSSVEPEGILQLSVINSTVYCLNQTVQGGFFATNFVKYVQGVGATSVTPSKSSIQGGQSVNLTVQLNDVAPAGGLAVYWLSNSSALGLPTSVITAAGKSVLTITALTQPVDIATPVTITAEVNGGDRTTTVTLMPAVLSAVTFPGGASASVVGGKTITGTIQLSGPTALLPHAVTLSSNSAKATVPTSVSVLPGALTATFVVNTTTVTANTPVVITATLAGVKVTANLTVAP
ncbi:MAG TPA: hypothetical protein VGL56_14515 [Fimbriimonadaceae bacterium]|jgi:hypothetical protein